jgi:hypothetical protein
MLRRLRFPIAALIWVCLVYPCWLEIVPLVPADSLETEPDDILAGITADGHLVMHYGRATGGWWGPLTIRNPHEHATIRSMLTRSDRILDIHLGSRPLVASHDDNGRMSVTDMETGQRVFFHNCTAPIGNAHFSDDGRRIAVMDSIGVAVFDIDGGRELFARKEAGLHCYGFIGPELVTTTDGKGSPPTRWDIRTGAKSNQLSDPQMLTAKVSSDGGSVIGYTRGITACGIYDYSTGALRWTLAHDPAKNEFFRPTFSADGSSVLFPAETEAGVRVHRWPAEAETPPERTSGRPFNGLVTDGRYIVVGEGDKSVALPSLIVSALKLVGSNRSRLYLAGIRLTLLDGESGRFLGQIFMDDPGPLEFNSAYYLSDRGIAVQTNLNWIRFYTLPPQYDWKRLAQWALLPPLTVWTLLVLFRRMKKRRRALAAVV